MLDQELLERHWQLSGRLMTASSSPSRGRNAYVGVSASGGYSSGKLECQEEPRVISLLVPGRPSRAWSGAVCIFSFLLLISHPSNAPAPHRRHNILCLATNTPLPLPLPLLRFRPALVSSVPLHLSSSSLSLKLQPRASTPKMDKQKLAQLLQASQVREFSPSAFCLLPRS